jgi:protein SCO1/2
LNPGVRNTVALCLAFVALVLGALVYTSLRKPLADDATLREQGTFVLPVPREIGPFHLTDQRGDVLDNESLRGHWSFLYFGFTSCPDICPVTLSALAQAQAKLADAGETELLSQLKVYFISVDPERDTQEKLAAYVGAFSPQFTGATGSLDELAALGKQLNVAFMKVPGPDGGYVMDHTGNIVVVDPNGHYYAFMKLPHEPDRIVLAYRSMANSF